MATMGRHHAMPTMHHRHHLAPPSVVLTFAEAYGHTFTLDEAIDELALHGVVADYDTDDLELFDCTNGETIALADRHGVYKGADVLAYCGY